MYIVYMPPELTDIIELRLTLVTLKSFNSNVVTFNVTLQVPVSCVSPTAVRAGF